MLVHIRRGVVISDSFLLWCLAIPDVRWVGAGPTLLRIAECPMERLHIGNLIRKEVERQGLTVVDFARQLGCSRTNIYKIYDHQSIDTAQLQRISLLLHCDFFRFYSESLQMCPR